MSQVCVNDAGYKCLHRFEYEGKTYDRCTTDGSPDIITKGQPSLPWCYDIRGNKEWDYCSMCIGMHILYFFGIYELQFEIKFFQHHDISIVN